MPRATTPSFITELPIKASSYELAVLKKRFWAAKQQYNALLGEALKRLRCMRQDPRFKQAHSLYKQPETKAQAKALFEQLRQEYAYSEYGMHTYCRQWNKGHWLSIGSHISQKLASRAFKAVEEYRLGKRGKPRFKGYRGLASIEASSIEAILRLKGRTLHYKGLTLPLLYNQKDPIHHHGLSSPIKYVRLMRRLFNGKTRYFAQLVNEGTPWVKSKNLPSKGTVGLDLGPQTIASVCPDKGMASLQVFADELKPQKQLKKRLQQKLSRQLRAANPHCFQQDKWERKDKRWKLKKGTFIKGKRLKNRPQALQKTSAKLADICRRQAAYRKSAHGKMVNDILRQGTHIKTEKLSYKSFQRLFGSSVGLRAPGHFVQLLKRKAESAGGKVEEINPYKTALSQVCQCGARAKKPLAQRWHHCSCGVQAQRDLYSAYLACFVENNTLIASQAQVAWKGMDIALSAAMSDIKGSSGQALPTSLGLGQGQKASHSLSP